MALEICKECGGNGRVRNGICRKCGGFGFTLEVKTETREEIIQGFRLAAKGDYEYFKSLMAKRFGNFAAESALDFWHGYRPMIV